MSGMDKPAPVPSHRWNVEPYELGVRLCRGDHDRSAPCEWEYLSPLREERAAHRKATTPDPADDLALRHIPSILLSIRDHVLRCALAAEHIEAAIAGDDDDALEAIIAIQLQHTEALRRIETLLAAQCPRMPSLGVQFEGFEDERTEPMPETITLPEAKDNQRWRVRILPRKADGHINASLTGVTWVSTDESVVGTLPGTQPFDFEDVRLDEAGNELWREVVTCPGFFRCKFLTPLASGTGVNVTVSAPGYDSAVFTNLTYSQGVPLSLNASFGEIEADDTDDPNW